MSADTRTGLDDGTRIGALWAANLLGPVAALVGLELAYVLAERACGTGRTLPLHLSFLGTLLVAVFGGALGWREWRRWGGGFADDGGGPESRSRFLALLGMLTGAVFALVIVAEWSATLFLNPCQ